MIQPQTFDFEKAFLSDWHLSQGFFLVWLSMTTIDFVMGLLLATKKRNVQSQRWREGLMKKATIALLLVGFACIDTILPNVAFEIPGTAISLTVTIAAAWSIFFCGSEIVSYGEIISAWKIVGGKEVGRFGKALKATALDVVTKTKKEDEKHDNGKN